MRLTCSKVGDTRCVSMDATDFWLNKRIIVIISHFDAKKPRCTPDKLCWLFLFVISSFAKKSMLVFVLLQGLTTIASKQKDTLLGLISTYFCMTGMTGSYQEEELQDINHLKAEVAGAFILTHFNARQCIDGTIPSVFNSVESLPEDEDKRLVIATAKLFVEKAHGITQTFAEQDANNNDGSELPSFIPKYLVKIDMKDFMKIIDRHKPHLRVRMSESEIEGICMQFDSIKRAYREELSLKNAADACDDINADFSIGWRRVMLLIVLVISMSFVGVLQVYSRPLSLSSLIY